MTDTTLWKRKFSLLVVKGDKALDLSELHCKFTAEQCDLESPNNCRVRVYNLAPNTIEQVKEYGKLVLQAGYESQFGVIFSGTIRQFGTGRENAKDTYLDIFASDGDVGYNFGVVNTTLGPRAKPVDQARAAIGAMAVHGVTEGYLLDSTGGVLPRGKVLFGMARDYMRQYANTQKSTWSIQDGKVNVIPLDGYKPGQVVELNAGTGLIGVPEQTSNGVNLTCLMNPRLDVGSAIRLNNKDINQIIQANKALAPIPYNQWTGMQLLAKVTTDGLYRLFVVEHEGDTRGNSWHSHLTCLAIDPSSNKVRPYG